MMAGYVIVTHADDWLLSHLECIYLYMYMGVSLIAASCLLLRLRRQRKTASIAMMLDGTGYDSDEGGHGAEDIFDDVCLCSREQQQA